MHSRVSNAIRSAALTLSVALGILACVVSTPQITTAQAKGWAQLIDDGHQLQAQGRYAEAEASFQSAVDQANAPFQPQAAARSMNYLAVVKQIRGNYPAAEALYRGAMDICERNPAPLDMAAILLNQARLCAARSEFDQAEALCRRSFEIHRSRLGPDHPTAVTDYSRSFCARALLRPTLGRVWRPLPTHLAASNSIAHRNSLAT